MNAFKLVTITISENTDPGFEGAELVADVTLRNVDEECDVDVQVFAEPGDSIDEIVSRAIAEVQVADENTADGQVRYPHITVELIGTNGNAFALLGEVAKALRDNHVPASAVDAFLKEATSSDYTNVLQTIMKTVNVI